MMTLSPPTITLEALAARVEALRGELAEITAQLAGASSPPAPVPYHALRARAAELQAALEAAETEHARARRIADAYALDPVCARAVERYETLVARARALASSPGAIRAEAFEQERLALAQELQEAQLAMDRALEAAQARRAAQRRHA